MTTSFAPPRTARVLIVEDNKDLADSLARFLGLGYGYTVAVEYDGAAGVASAEANPPDAVICDLALPRRNGLLVGEEIAELVRPRPLLIAVTAFDDDRLRALAADAGFDHFLTKPADPLAIEALIATHLAARGEPGLGGGSGH